MSSAGLFGFIAGYLIVAGIRDREAKYFVMGMLLFAVTILTATNVFHLGGGA